MLLLSRFIFLDANDILTTRVDLMGFVVMGVVMLPRLFSADVLMRIKTFAAILVCFFLFYLVIALLSAERDLLPALASRHGLMPWLLVGFMAAIAAEDLSNYVANSPNSIGLLLGMISPPLALLIPAYAIRDASEGTFDTIRYQQVSGSGTILMLGVVLVLQSLWKTSVKTRSTFLAIISATTYIAASLVLAYLIAKLQSTAIVLVFLALAGCVSLLILRHVSLISLIGLLLLVAIPGGLFLPDLLSDLVQTTRFSSITEGDWLISSVRSRLALLELFWDQWGYSPLTGDFDVDTRFGGQGNYVHSLPLSLLTHTGIFGFAICLAAFYLSSLNELGRFRPHLLLVVVFVIASLATFFTWTPVWFVAGIALLHTRSSEYYPGSGMAYSQS